MKFNQIQGKGWGSASLSDEVKTILQFADDLKMGHLVVCDVGANVGLWSQELLRQKPEAEVYCFEPARGTFEILLRNSALDRATVQRYQLALGSVQGEAPIYYDEVGSGLASLTKRQLDHFGISFDKSEVVQVETLDNWCQKTQTVPSIIKMDVEGHELDVLKGSIAVLESVRIVQFEFGGCNIDTRTYWQDFWYFFSSRGFKIFRVSPLGPIPVPFYKETDEYFQTTNYLAIRE